MKKDLRHILTDYFDEHPRQGILILALFVFACLVILWMFLMFSGINTSAGFVYNQF